MIAADRARSIALIHSPRGGGVIAPIDDCSMGRLYVGVRKTGAKCAVLTFGAGQVTNADRSFATTKTYARSGIAIIIDQTKKHGVRLPGVQRGHVDFYLCA